MTKAETRKEFLRTTVPMDWAVARLDDCLELLTDFEANGSFAGVKENVKIFESIEYAWYVRATDLENESKIEEVKYVDEKTYNFLRKTKLTGGEVLITKRGEIGKVYLFEKKTAFATVAPNLYLLKLNNSVLPYFIYSFFKAEIGNRELRKIDSSSTLGALYKDDVKALKIPLPPLPEQKAIAQVLSRADAAIHTTEKLIAQKELRKKWLMQQLLTGKKRLKGFDGEWKEKQLKKLCKISKGEQLNKIELDKTGTYPSYSGGITPSGYTDDWNTHENTIIISEGGNSCGYVNFITTKFWCGGHCYALLDLNQTIKRDFLYQFLKFNELQIMKLRVGSGLPNVQKGDVENFSVKHPSFEEQTAIAQVLQTADKEISLLKAKAEKLREQKKGLMQVLLTGKVRLKNKE
jgi:type I restriction enzyme, S subunit